jgi:hypothetical protein
MKRKDWIILITLLLIIALTIISPYLPGPSSLSSVTNSFHNFYQLLSLPLLLFIPFGLIWTIRRNRKNCRQDIKKSLLIPNALWSVPLTIFISLFFLSQQLIKISRNIAINRSTELIASLEKYKTENGSYPQHIVELIPKYFDKIPKPNVMGIPNYGYKKQDNSYKITFEQNVLLGFNFEVVIYSPTDDYLSDVEHQLLKETGKGHWKYYLFD